MSMKKTRIEKLKEKFPSLTQGILYDLYVTKQMSLPLIRKHCGIDFKACQDLLRHYGIPVRTASQARLTPVGKERIRNSYREKYGVENPSQIESVKQKKRDTFNKHYGVDNIWKSPEYYKWLEDYMLIHYGVKRVSTNPWGWNGAGEKRKADRIKKLWRGRDMWWVSLSDEEKSAIMGRVCSANTIGSKIGTRVAEALDRLHITYRRWVSVGVRNFDFEIDGCKVLVEVNGDFWHANPEIYDADDLVPFPNGCQRAKTVWENDERKRLTAERFGYRLLTIWESELKKTSDLLLEKWLVAKIVV